MQKQSSPQAINAQRSYRAALERAFAAGKLDELAKTLVRPADPTPAPARPSSPGQAQPQSAASDGETRPAAPAAPDPAQTPVPAAAAKDPDREQKQKLLAKIRESEGRDAITRSVDAYAAKYGKVPDDFEILTKCLGHKNDDRVRQTLDQLTALMQRDKPRRGRTLAAQLRILEDTHGDPEIRAVAARVRGQL